MSITFDGVTERIILTPGTVVLSVRDLWSRWVDWFLTGDNSKYLPALVNVGGDDIDLITGIKIPIFVFVMNGWKIKPQEASHSLTVNDGILVGYGGIDPFIDTIGSYVVRIKYQQPVQVLAISSTASGGATPEEIWAYANRLLSTEGVAAIQAGLAPEGEYEAIFIAMQAVLNTIDWSDVTFLKDIEGGRWKIEGFQMKCYKADNTTVIATFNLYDSKGNLVSSPTAVWDRKRA